MKTTNHQTLKKIINIAYQHKKPIMIWGGTGIGKSDLIRQYTTENNIELIDLRLSQLDNSDLRGLPQISNQGATTTKWLPPDFLPKQDSESKGILFIDEINLAPPSLQATAYQLINDRQVGDYKLPAGWVCIGAGNRTEDRGHTFDMAIPLKNRFTHIELGTPEVEKWVNEYAIPNQVNTNIITFLQYKPSYLYKIPTADEKEHSFPTPRSWTVASQLIKEEADEKLIETLISGCVGEGIALEYTAYHRLTKKIDIKGILDNPETVNKLERADEKYSCISAIAEEYRKDRGNLEKIIAVSNHFNAEFGILLARLVKGLNAQRFKTDLTKLATGKSKTFMEFKDKYGKYLIED